jgi:hypothetical protein
VEEVVFNDTGVFGLSFFYLASAAGEMPIAYWDIVEFRPLLEKIVT